MINTGLANLKIVTKLSADIDTGQIHSFFVLYWDISAVVWLKTTVLCADGSNYSGM
jgi:hypothetical protein